MNTKSILKRTLPLIIILVLVIGIAISCTLISTDRDVPSISNKNEIYATYKANGTDINVTNDDMYQVLKNNGLSFVLEWVDKKILSTEKNASNVSYYDAALADVDAIKAAKDEAIYGDEETKAELTDEEKTEAEDDYIETMTNSGYKGVTIDGLTDGEKELYALQNARELYAWDALAEDIKEQDELAKNDEDEKPYFTDDEIESYYSSNYEDSYWAIVISYSSAKAVERALEQLNIEYKEYTDTTNNNTKTKGWAWIDDAAEKPDFLTQAEVLTAFIMLYNNANAYKNNGAVTVDHTTATYEALIKDGKFDVNAAKSLGLEDYFYFEKTDLNAINGQIAGRISSALYDCASIAGDKDATETKSSYTKEAYTSSSTKFLMFRFEKIDHEETHPLWTDEEETVMDATIKAEIIAELTEEEKTDTLVKNKMAELRKEKGLMFYDSSLEAAYIKSYDSDFEKSKKENTKSVCVVDGNELSTDDYFKTLSVHLGSSYILDIINKELILLSEYNEVIDGYKPNMTYKELKKAVKDKEKWNELLESVQSLKNNFAGNAFSSYGFPSTYGWENFLKDFYLSYYGALITSDEDLMVYYIYQEALSNKAKAMNTYATDTNLQTKFDEIMKAEEAKFFNVGGFHLLISVYEEDGKTMVNPLETPWTDAQIAGAQELYNEIINKILPASEPEKVLEDFVTAYNSAPYYTLYDSNKVVIVPELSNQPGLDGLDKAPYIYAGLTGYLSIPAGQEIQISKYRSLGLSVKYESLAAFGPGKMVEEFETYAKAQWDELRADGELTYSSENKKWEIAADVLPQLGTPGTDDTYLITEFGYHVFTITSAEGFAGSTPTANKDANAELGTLKEDKGTFIEVYVPSAALLKKYIEVIESDEYKDLLASENYKAGDEDELFEEAGLTDHQIKLIEQYYSPLATELTGNYVTTLTLIKELNLNNLEAKNTNFDKEVFGKVLESQIEYCVEQLTYLSDLYK